MEIPELTLEQQFELERFKTEASKLSLEESQCFLLEIYRQMMIKDIMYKQMLKQEWGI